MLETKLGKGREMKRGRNVFDSLGKVALVTEGDSCSSRAERDFS